jgi:hypothetical protein
VDVGIKETPSFSLQAPNAFEGSALSYFRCKYGIDGDGTTAMWSFSLQIAPRPDLLSSVFYAWQFLQLSFTCLMGIFMRRVRAPCFSGILPVL